MNIVVIGLGSMGKRRIRLIKKNYPDVVVLGVDNNNQKKNEAFELFGIKTYDSLDDVDIDIKAAFVCSSPLSHAKIINKCLLKNINVFSEINLIDYLYDENIALAKNNNLVLFLSSTQLYKKEMQYINNYFKDKDNINYIYHIGQYLPDWHPWESYNNFFVGDKRTNGCREIMAIEFPWLINTFGEVSSFNVCKNKMTGLNIDYNDNYMILLEHVNGIKGSIVIDVVSPKAVRKFEAYSERKYISWDGTPNTFFAYDLNSNKTNNVNLYDNVLHENGYGDFIIENAYEEEIIEFFEMVSGHKKDYRYTFEEDKKVIELINRIED